MLRDVATRFLIDSNLHAVSFLAVDSDHDYTLGEEIRVRKVFGGYEIMRMISRLDRYGTERKIRRTFTHNCAQVKSVISYGIDIDSAPVFFGNRGKPSEVWIVRFAEK